LNWRLAPPKLRPAPRRGTWWDGRRAVPPDGLRKRVTTQDDGRNTYRATVVVGSTGVE